MLVPVALVAMLAAPAPAAGAPPPAPSAEVVAPAPAAAPVAAPAPATPAAPALAPAPSPAAAPPAAATTTTVGSGSERTVVTTSASGAGSNATSVVVVTRPPPPLPPPSYARTRPAPPIPHDPWRTRDSIRTYRRHAVGLLALGSLGMAGMLGSQWFRARDLQQCLNGPRGNMECVEADEMNQTYAGHGFMGGATLVLGTTWAGVLLGKAAATRDVLLRGRKPRSRPGLKLLGLAAIGASTAWMIGSNYTLARHESDCDGDHRCLAQYRPLRWAANDGAALGFGLGSGLLGYGMAYERQGTAIMRVRAAPSVSVAQAGMSVSVEF